jgi:hypothetical protein
MTIKFAKIACLPETRTLRACGEGRRLGGESGVFVPTIRTGRAEK